MAWSGSSLVYDDGHLLVIGRLEIRSETAAECGYYDIYQGEKILVGRDTEKCQLVLNDPAVSNWHLLIYSIIYDPDDPSGVKPLIYAEDRSSNGTYWNRAFIGKRNRGVLLSDGDELRISPRITLSFQTDLQYDKGGTDEVQQSEVKFFRDRYQLTPRKLGAGAQGHVYMAIDNRTGRQLACKMIDFRSVRKKEMVKGCVRTLSTKASKKVSERRIGKLTARILREVDIMKSLSHPNVIRLEKVFQTVNTLYIFEELITGGDLFSYIEHKNGRLNEAETAVIVRQILEALDYLHSLDIAHRDLKPENILMASLDDAARVILTDFGSSTRIIPQDGGRSRRMETMVGTCEYAAPEVQGYNKMVKVKGYTKAVDMWSLGCVAVAMLMGSVPFDVRCSFDQPMSLRDAPQKALPEYSLIGLYNRPDWVRLNYKAKDFVKRLLTLDEMTRMTAREALNHKIFTNCHDEKSFDIAYNKAIRGWKPHQLFMDIVEEIPSNVDHEKPLQSPRLPRKLRVNALNPIEPHYQPRHRNVDYFIPPLRSRIPPPTIREVAEEAQALISTVTGTGSIHARNNSSPPQQSLKHLTDIELPAVETLRLTEAGQSLRPSAHEPFLGRASHEDLLAEEMIWTTRKIPIAIHEDRTGSKPSGIESSNTLVLRENMSKCNYSLRSTNFNSQEEFNHASSLMATGLLKWPSSMSQETCRTTHDLDEGRVPPRRKRLRTYHIDMDENLESQASTVSSQIQNETLSNSFTTINRRKSMKLGDGQCEETAPRLSGAKSSAIPGVGHDGPLISKRASWVEPHHGALLGRLRPAEDLGSKDELMSAQPSVYYGDGRTGKRKTSTLYDYEEASIYAEAGMEC